MGQRGQHLKEFLKVYLSLNNPTFTLTDSINNGMSLGTDAHFLVVIADRSSGALFTLGTGFSWSGQVYCNVLYRDYSLEVLTFNTMAIPSHQGRSTLAAAVNTTGTMEADISISGMRIYRGMEISSQRFFLLP